MYIWNMNRTPKPDTSEPPKDFVRAVEMFDQLNRELGTRSPVLTRSGFRTWKEQRTGESGQLVS